jgi:hypothetical protein
VCVVALVAAIGINLVEFPEIDGGTHERYKAIYRQPTSDMIDIGFRDLAWARDRFGLAVALHAVAPNARIVLPEPGPYSGTDNETLNRLTWLRMARPGITLVRVTYLGELDLLDRVDVGLDRNLVASGRGSVKGVPWMLVLDPAHRPSDTGDPATFAQRVMDGAFQGPVEGPTRDFVLLRYDHPRPGLDHDHQDVLVELSLLPEGIRRELTP